MGGRAPFGGGSGRAGGGRGALIRYPEAAIWEEVTYLAYHLHWGLAELLELEHQDRRVLLRQVAGLNQRAWEAVTSDG